MAFLAAMEIMAEQFPGAFAGYSLQVHPFVLLNVKFFMSLLDMCDGKIPSTVQMEKFIFRSYYTDKIEKFNSFQACATV